MDYVLLLEEIRNLPEEMTEFSARELFLFLLIKQRKFEEKKHLLTVKSISNDLGRLYRMQLLKRRRVKRAVASAKYNRGYMYLYKLSSQGKSYAEYLKTPSVFRGLLQSKKRQVCNGVLPTYTLFKKSLGQNLPNYDEQLGLFALQLFQQHTSISKPSCYNRFPPKIDLGLFVYAMKAREQVRDLKDENNEQESKIVEQEREIQSLEDGRDILITGSEEVKEIVIGAYEAEQSKTGVQRLRDAISYLREELADDPFLEIDPVLAHHVPGARSGELMHVPIVLIWVARQLEKNRTLFGREHMQAS
jgi:hypothetical protein